MEKIIRERKNQTRHLISENQAIKNYICNIAYNSIPKIKILEVENFLEKQYAPSVTKESIKMYENAFSN